MRVDLAGKTAIVTGGAQGIGRAIVELLAANGAAVAIIDVAAEAAQQTAAEFSARGQRVAAFTADVSDERAMQDVVARIVGEFLRIDILVNNAGINTVKDRVPIDAYHREDWDRILRVDLTGAFVVSQVVIRALKPPVAGES